MGGGAGGGGEAGKFRCVYKRCGPKYRLIFAL